VADHFKPVSVAAPQALAAADAPSIDSHTAQAIQCGPWSLALSFDWANTIVDQFELVNIPKAAPWLIGAVNLDGGIVPVVDLAAYFEPGKPPAPIDRHHRLLMGGRMEGSNENAVAILFLGLPFQIQYTRAPLGADVALPERLRELCRGVARSETGQLHFEIDTPRFIDHLSVSLMDI
jgi:chemotaxis signal transduction protein